MVENHVFLNIVQGVRKKYDLIFWNIPFVSSNKTQLKKITGLLFKPLERFATESDDGTRLIRRFLSEAPVCLKPHGLLIFASNTGYVPEAKIRKLIKLSGLHLCRTYAQGGNASRAYVLTASGAASLD